MLEFMKRDLASMDEAIELAIQNDQADTKEFTMLKKERRMLAWAIRMRERKEKKNGIR